MAASGEMPFAGAVWLGLSGSGAIVAMSLYRSLNRPEPLLHLRPDPASASGRQPKRWCDVANPKGNYANRWAMYDDLAGWLSSRDWTGKAVAEIGRSNGALRHFIDGAQYCELTYPSYDIQHLHQVPDNQFDLVILDQTLEHVAEPELALREVRRILTPGAVAIITTPFLIPVHPGDSYGDYYRWTPQGMEMILRRCGFDPEVCMWGNRRAAKALLDDMYLLTDRALKLGLSLSTAESETNCPITVWAVATSLKDGAPQTEPSHAKS